MKELEALPDRIEALETEQAGINSSLANPDIYRDNPEQAKALQLRLAALEQELVDAMNRWEQLESRR